MFFFAAKVWYGYYNRAHTRTPVIIQIVIRRAAAPNRMRIRVKIVFV